MSEPSSKGGFFQEGDKGERHTPHQIDSGMHLAIPKSQRQMRAATVNGLVYTDWSYKSMAVI